MTNPGQQRPVRSFVRREGRITPAQKRAVTEFWSRYGIDVPASPVDPASFFGNERPVVAEIGFGDGECLLSMGASDPGTNFLGIDVHRPGVGRLLLRLDRAGLENVRVACADAVEFLAMLSPASLARALILFPDPWPKKRHHKRRLVQRDFVVLVAGRLEAGGELHVATDSDDYADSIRHCVGEVPDLVSVVDDGYCERPDYRPETKYERRGRRLGNNIWNIRLRKTART
jgi:tRNA (guanine-N7-)-methyltransferase